MESSRELFAKAFGQAEADENQAYKNEDDFEWDFSDKFEKSMQKIINKDNRIKFQTRRKISKSLIAAIIAVAVMFGGIMSVSATRKPFIEFIKRTFSQYNELTLSEDSTPPTDFIETEYTLGYIPDGYEIKTYQSDEYGLFSVWENKDGDEITFIQDLLDANISVDNEHKYKEIELNGYTAYITSSDKYKNIWWTNGTYWFNIGMTNDANNEILQLAENISPKN